jgi:hypothetical protein
MMFARSCFYDSPAVKSFKARLIGWLEKGD